LGAGSCREAGSHRLILRERIDIGSICDRIGNLAIDWIRLLREH